MTVELKEPFVWPDPPEDFSPYVYVPSLCLLVRFAALVSWKLICVSSIGADGTRMCSSIIRNGKMNIRKWRARIRLGSLIPVRLPFLMKLRRRSWMVRGFGDLLGRLWGLTMIGLLWPTGLVGRVQTPSRSRIRRRLLEISGFSFCDLYYTLCYIDVNLWVRLWIWIEVLCI